MTSPERSGGSAPALSPLERMRAKGLRNAWLLNVWRMRRLNEDGMVIDYFVRGGTVVVTRIRKAA